MGLVRRYRCDRDERRVFVALTETGTDMKDRAAHVPGCIADRTGLPPDEILAMRDVVIALRDTLRRG